MRNQAAIPNTISLENEIVSKKSRYSGQIASKVKDAKKGKLRVVEHYLCDNCDKVISNPEEGFVIHGNIYAADASQIAGLIGNNFPDEEESKASEVKKSVYCKFCFLQAIGITASLPPKMLFKGQSSLKC